MMRDRFDDRVRLEQPIKDSSFTGAGKGSWDLVEEIWARVDDLPMPRGEQLNEGKPSVVRRARVRIWRRDDVTAAMRFVIDGRELQIVAGPAIVGDRRDRMEFTVEEYAPAGNRA